MITLLVQATEKAKKFADETTKNAQMFASAARKEVSATLKKFPDTDLTKTGENLLRTVKSFSFATPMEVRKLEERISRLEARLDDALAPISIDDGEEEEETKAKASSAKEEKPEKVLKTGTVASKKARKKTSSRESVLN